MNRRPYEHAGPPRTHWIDDAPKRRVVPPLRRARRLTFNGLCAALAIVALAVVVALVAAGVL